MADVRLFRTRLPVAPAATTSGLGLFGWLIYEWASQPFYSLVTTFLFAPYFVNGFVGDPVRGQSLWLYAAGAAGLCVAILSPLLGAFADSSGHRKPWILGSLTVFAVSMAGLWFTEPAHLERIYVILAIYMVAAVAAEITATFVNAMMPGLVDPEHYGRVSGNSAALGYIGGLVALIVVAGLLVGDAQSGKTLLGLPPLLTLDAASHQGDRLVGPFCAAWLVLFSVPLFLFTPDRQAARTSGGGLAGLAKTIGELEQHKDVVLFLVARMLFTDGLLAMFSVGAIYGAALFGWQAEQLGLFGIILIVSAILGAAIGGVLDDWIGPKAVILLALVLAMVAAAGVVSIDHTHVLFVQEVAAKPIASSFLSAPAERWFVGFTILVGLVTGPLSASSRSLMARLAPKDRVTQFFGLFAFSGKASSFLAPLLVGVITTATGEQRWGVAVVLAFLLAGLVMMPFVRSKRDDDVGTAAPLEPAPAAVIGPAPMPRERRRNGSGTAARRSAWPDILGGLIVTLLLVAAIAVIALSAVLGR